MPCEERAEREAAGRRSDPDPFRSALLGGLGGASNPRASAPASLTWPEAKARAARLFPGQRVVVDLDELDNDFGGMSFLLGMGSSLQRVVALGRLGDAYFHPFRHARHLEVG